MNIPHVVMGTLLLFLGRRLFWMFVGIAGFFAGVQFGGLIFAGEPQWLVLLIAFFVGLLGILATLFLGRVAFGIGGFFAGAYLAMTVIMSMGGIVAPFTIFLAGGIIGAIVAILFMDWAIIFLSSLMGAGAIALNLPLYPPASVLVFMALVVAGIVYQGSGLQKTRNQNLLR